MRRPGYPTFVQSGFETRNPDAAQVAGVRRRDAVGSARDPMGSVPLTLSPDPRTPPRPAPCSSACARCAPQDPAARGADVGRRGPLPARAGGGGDRVRRRGADVPPAGRGRSPRRPGVRGRPLGPRRARPRGARRGARHAPAGAGRVSARTRLRRRGRRRCSPSSAARSSRRRGSRARCAAGRRAARRPRTPRSSRRCTRPTTGGWRRLGAPRREGHARAALDALRERPAAWGARPVLLYGFDDLTPLQLDAVETLAGRAEAEVWVALPYEAGRAAFAGRAATVELLKPLAARHVALAGPLRALRARRARRALHHLERRLFEGGGEPCSPNGAVRLLEAGGERAEAELVAAEVLELMREGVAPEDIAVLVRERRRARSSVLAAGLADYGVPVAPGRAASRWRARGSAPGVLAFARAALPGRHGRRRHRPGCARPASSPTPTPPTRSTRGCGARRPRRRPTRARLWEGAAAPSSTRSPRRAARRARSALLDALLAEAEAIWTAPHRRRAAVLGREEAADARAAAELRAAARRAARARGGRPRAAGRRRRGGAGGARRGDRSARTPAPGGVLVAAAPAIRARRFRAVFVCGLQDGEFPRRPSPEPFLDDDARAVARARERARAAPPRGRAGRGAPPLLRLRVAAGGGAVPLLPLLRRGGRPGAAVAVRRRRPRAVHRRAVARARHAAAGRGHVAARHRADAARAARARRRPPSAAPEPAPLAPPGSRRGARGAGRARAGGGARAGDVRRLRRALARRVACSSRQRAEPDPSRCAAARSPTRCSSGRCARLRERTGSARLAPDTLDAALAELDRALGAVRALPRPRAGERPRARPALRALEEDLVRYLRHEAECGAGLEPRVARVELRARGRQPRRARAQRLGLLRHGPRRPDRRRRQRRAPWCATTRARRSTPARAGRRTGGCRRRCTRSRRASCSGSSRPARSTSRSARATAARAGFVRGGHAGPLRQRRRRRARGARRPRCCEAREAALGAARAMRAGRIRPCPSRCSPNGCAYPGICRAGEEPPEERRERARAFTAEQRAAVEDRVGLGAAGRQRRLGQDRGDGRAVRRGGARSTACRSARSSR